MSFGERLKQLREDRELTQRALADLIKIGYSTLAMYETNKRQPDFDLLNELASFFDVTTDYLLERTDDPRPLTKIANTTITGKSDKELFENQLRNELLQIFDALTPEAQALLLGTIKTILQHSTNAPSPLKSSVDENIVRNKD